MARDAPPLGRKAASLGAQSRDLQSREKTHWAVGAWTISVVAFLLVLACRLPWASHYLYHWDSVNFAMAIGKFDVAAGQPHVPGYILYVGMLRLVNLVFADAQSSMLAVSFVASGLGVVGLYWLGNEMFGRWAGACASLLFATSPLYWFYGEIALPHALDAAMVIFTVLLLYRIETGKGRHVVLMAIWLGVLGGFRPQTQVFLLPLAMYSYRKQSLRTLSLSLIGMGVADLLWLVPLVAASGGLRTYVEVFRDFYAAFNSSTALVEGAGMAGFVRNVRKVAMYSLYGLSLATIPFAWAVVVGVHRRFREKSKRVDARLIFLVIWIAPSLLFYVLQHMGQQGLVFVYLPALFLVGAWGMQETREIFRGWKNGAIAFIAVGNALIFLVAPTYPLGHDSFKVLTAATLREHDHSYSSRIAAVRDNLEPTSTLLISDQWRFPQYYLSEYPLLPYELAARGEQGEGQPTLGVNRSIDPWEAGLVPSATPEVSVVLFDPELQPFAATQPYNQSVTAPGGDTMLVWSISKGTRIVLTPEGMKLVEPSS